VNVLPEDRIVISRKESTATNDYKMLGLPVKVSHHLALEAMARETNRTKTEVLNLALDEFFKRATVQPEPES
jgi:hypothetical protein